jgi:glutamine transport system ATP-binding protein
LLSDHDIGFSAGAEIHRKKDEDNMSDVIEFINVSKSFGKVEVLHDIDLAISEKEVVVVVGPSGSGKSTLLRCINGLESVTKGELIVNGISLPQNKKQIREIRKEVGMVFQLFHLFPHMTALDNVAFGPKKVRGASKSEADRVAKDLLEKVGLSDRSGHYPSELSGGQQQRVAIARAMAVKPKIMLFDEPTSALDPELREEVLNVMIAVADEGITMVVVTHEMSFASKAGSRLLFMDGGRIAEDGDPETLLKFPTTDRLKDFLQHVGY